MVGLFSVHYVLPSQQAPQLVSTLVNGCGSPDGATEYMVVYSGSTSFTASTTSINIQYSTSTVANLFTITDTFVSGGNATFVANLNGLLNTCDFTFVNVNPSSTLIPAGSHILILNDDITSAIDFSAWCGQNLTNVYVLFSSDSSWPANGVFANASATNRLMRSVINVTQTDFSYANNWASNADGNYVQWNDGGGAGAVYSNYPNCEPNNTNSLPVSLLYFDITQTSDKVLVEWATDSEIGNSHFTIYRSQNGYAWDELGMVSGKGDSDKTVQYEYSDRPPVSGRYYYKLKQTDFNGAFEFFFLLRIDYLEEESPIKIYPNPTTDFILVETDATIVMAIFANLHGQSVELTPVMSDCELTKFNVEELTRGLYSVLLFSDRGLLIKRIIVIN
jgi:hypothetical protein